METRVTLTANAFTSLEATVDALGTGRIKIRSDLVDLEVGLVTAGETPSALPEIDAKGVAVLIMKPHESVLEVWAHSVIGGDIYVSVAGNPLIVDTTGVTSA